MERGMGKGYGKREVRGNSALVVGGIDAPERVINLLRSR